MLFKTIKGSHPLQSENSFKLLEKVKKFDTYNAHSHNAICYIH